MIFFKSGDLQFSHNLRTDPEQQTCTLVLSGSTTMYCAILFFRKMEGRVIPNSTRQTLVPLCMHGAVVVMHQLEQILSSCCRKIKETPAG